jgi:hypothetical protein
MHFDRVSVPGDSAHWWSETVTCMDLQNESSRRDIRPDGHLQKRTACTHSDSRMSGHRMAPRRLAKHNLSYPTYAGLGFVGERTLRLGVAFEALTTTSEPFDTCRFRVIGQDLVPTVRSIDIPFAEAAFELAATFGGTKRASTTRNECMVVHGRLQERISEILGDERLNDETSDPTRTEAIEALIPEFAWPAVRACMLDILRDDKQSVIGVPPCTYSGVRSWTGEKYRRMN